MKKFFTAVIALAAFGLVACNQPASTPTPEPEPEPAEKCTAHEDGYEGYFLTGPNCIQVNGVKASENKGKEWDFGGDSFELKATELAKVKDIDKDVFDALTAKGTEVKGIYTLSGVAMGLTKEGWGQNFKDGDDIYKANASYVAKIIKTKYNEEDDAWSTQQWIPDPKTAHVENLKNYWCPTWQEKADEYGFAWDQNPVVTDNAGIYTVVLAVYNGGAAADHCNYGVAFVKTQELPVAYEKLLPWDADGHNYELIGEFNSWADAGTIALAKDTDGVFTAQITLDDPTKLSFKVRVAGTWDVADWGTSSVQDDASKALIDLESGNIKVKEVGTYKVSMSFKIFSFEIGVKLEKVEAQAQA